ncbi:MAG: carbamoyltransferase HypF [Actinomycetota bacterium]|nr:carbamoyltransferase HypF [Actinomycetota bacterium]
MTFNSVRKKRKRLLVSGVVQGVGFRPLIYRLAHEHDLKGWVSNSPKGVVIEVEGEERALKRFIEEVRPKAPPLASIDGFEVEDMALAGYSDFTIEESEADEAKSTLVSPDIATCKDCLSEIFDPADRRHRYPFTNCTNCGPRFTIIEDLPYDRDKTTMKKFTMCALCASEYNDPLNRRFHAQPNACPVCGPKLILVGSGKLTAGGRDREIDPDDPIKEAARLLKEGKIVAIKGLGGFQLACDAQSEAAVSELRKRKRRPAKPFAVMMGGLAQVREHALAGGKEEEILLGTKRPVLLLEKRPHSGLAASIAPAVDRFGVMLPYTPLHHLLMEEVNLPLVMTSGNLSEEPIAYKNGEALGRLSSIADHFLLSDRDIHSRYDDSVAEVTNGQEVIVRRARGYAPAPINLTYDSKPILAVGPELKNTFTLAKGSYAFVSQHFGDMEDMETFSHFEETLSLYNKLFAIRPKIVAHDLHPDYMTTKFAKSMDGVELVAVQHHHAHITSCMVENGLEDEVIGLAFDGSGLGTDSSIWGGEFFLCDLKSFSRLGHLKEVALPGGDAAIRAPYRMALSHLINHFGPDLSHLKLDFLKRMDDKEMENIKIQVERGIASPPTSSMGRLFDAAAALIGIRERVSYEGQAAIELEAAASLSEEGAYPFTLTATEKEGSSHPVWAVDAGPLIEAMVSDLNYGEETGVISAKFHGAVVDFSALICERISEATGIDKVALSGGVFQNRLLSNKLISRLEALGFSVYTHKLVPTNDGGISLGQAAVANFNLRI